MTLITAVIAYPNPFTRMNSSALIKQLVSQCRPEDDTALCDYRRDSPGESTGGEIVSGPLSDRAVGAMWQLALALVFKMVITVFTFGIKVKLWFKTAKRYVM